MSGLSPKLPVDTSNEGGYTLNKTYPSGERQYNWNEDIKNSAINKKGFKFNIKNQEGKFIQYSDFFAFDTKQSKENKEPINRTFVFEQEITMKKGQKYTLLVKDELLIVRSRLVVLSHPFILVTTLSYIPEVEYVTPFQE